MYTLVNIHSNVNMHHLKMYLLLKKVKFQNLPYAISSFFLGGVVKNSNLENNKMVAILLALLGSWRWKLSEKNSKKLQIQGSLNGTHFAGINQCKCMVI